MKGCRELLKNVVVAVILGVAFMANAQELVLDDIGFNSLPGNKFEIELGFSGPPPEPRAYTIDTPARIVLDFLGVESVLKEKKYALAFENAKNVAVLTAGNKTRLIVNLDHMTTYSSTIEGNSLILMVGSGESVVQVTEMPAASYANTSFTGRDGRVIENVDFSRGEMGEGLVTLMVSDPSMSVDVSRMGNKITVKFFHTGLPEELDRRLDVIDFATPVKSVDATMTDSSTVITIDALGDYDYLAYQADDQYVISVKPLTPSELEEKNARFSFVGEKLSLNFQDIEVRSVLQLIADFTELNLVASDTVTGNITLRLENVPWDQALSIVLKAKGLDKRQEGNVLMVAPTAEIAESERLQVEANRQIQELAPLVTEFIRVRYADAVELFALFNVDDGLGEDDRSATTTMLSERGSAIVDQRTNTIILTDTEDKIAQFKKLIEKIDIPIRQVEISARIVIATTDFRRELGVRWGAQGASAVGDNVLGVSGGIEGFTIPYNPMNRFPRGGAPFVQAVDEQGKPIPAITPTGAISDAPGNFDIFDGLNVDLGVANPTGKIALEFLTDNLFLDMELSALASDGYAEIASQPKILTGDKQKAIIRSGQEIAYQQSTSSGATSVKFKEAVLKLEVTPQITPDNKIILDLFISQDNIANIAFNGIPALDITDIQSRVLVGDGQTLVLGGIFQYEELNDVEKVPVLGDLPFVGKLFKNTFRSTEKREILIFVTPKIVDEQLLDR